MTSTAGVTTAPIRPRALGVATATPTRALALAGVGGVGIALQAFLNGRLSGDLGSVEVAAAMNNFVGLVALAALVLGTRSVGRAVGRVRDGAVLRPWYFAGGALGAALVAVSTAAAPKVGVALLTVALVCGQTTGSLGVDAAGLSPSGRHGITVPRVLGVAIAIVAVAVSAFGAGGNAEVGLLAAAVGAGVLAAIQQAVNGRLAAATGEPSIAAVVNFAVGLGVLAGLAVIVAWGDDVHWSAPIQDWLGGLLGAFFVIVTAAAVRALGVLRLMLVVVAGQSAGALFVDLAWPAEGESVTAWTVAGVVLTLVAVAVTAGAGRRRG